jgi:hypothetical protein
MRHDRRAVIRNHHDFEPVRQRVMADLGPFGAGVTAREGDKAKRRESENTERASR